MIYMNVYLIEVQKTAKRIQNRQRKHKIMWDAQYKQQVAQALYRMDNLGNGGCLTCFCLLVIISGVCV